MAVMTEQEKQARIQSLAKELDPSNWNSLNLQKRTELLQRVENLQAELQNRPAATVSNEPMATNQHGYYCNQKIVQNQDMVKYCKTSDMATKNLFHEGRHAYQKDVVAHPENHPEVSAETRDAWDRNLAPNGYVNPEDDTFLYYWQPVEVDARAYAETQSLEYTKSLAQNQTVSEEHSVLRASTETQSLSTGEDDPHIADQGSEESVSLSASDGVVETASEVASQSDSGYSQSIA